MDLFVPESWDDSDDPECMALRKKTKMPETVRHVTKWQMALDLVDLARKDQVPHRAVLADSWYGTIPEFRQGLADRGENYIVGVYSNSQIFLEAPILEIQPVKEQKRGRPRKKPTVVSTNPLPVLLSDIGESIADDLARLYHERYWIEQGYQQLKEELGLDHHEGRSWIGWLRSRSILGRDYFI